MDIIDEVSIKVRDTLAGVAAAAKSATVSEERQFARTSLAGCQWRVAFHLEQPATASRLRPVSFDPAVVRQALRRKVKPVDARAVVCNLSSNIAGIPWTARSIGSSP